MVRRHKSSWMVLAGCLVGACLGGQTGEPMAGEVICTFRTAWQESVDGVSPEQLALTYQGEHRAKLHWEKNPDTVTEPVTLTLDYREQSGTTDLCNGGLSLSVNFSLRADDGTLIDSGQGSLSAARGEIEHATYSGLGQHFWISGSLSAAMGKVMLSGRLEPRKPTTADFADFSSF